MRSIKIVNGKRSTVAVVVTCAALAFAAAPVRAGSLTPPAGPADPGSAMFTIGDVYSRLSSGAAGVKRTGAFAEPADLGATMRTLDEVMNAAPAVSASGAAVDEVCDQKTFWGLRSGGGWGPKTGSGACPPVFLGVFGPFSIAENTTSGDVGTPVTATGTGVAYSIFAGDPDGVFAIDSGTGQITRNSSPPIDYETTRSYLLTIRATIGTAHRDLHVTVKVTNVDDAAPVFLTDSPFGPFGPFRVVESAVVGTVVGRVVAVDPDTTAANLTYTITGGNIPGNRLAFSDTNKGEIVVDTALVAGAASHTLTVQVTDGASHSDTATVNVTVVDVTP